MCGRRAVLIAMLFLVASHRLLSQSSTERTPPQVDPVRAFAAFTSVPAGIALVEALAEQRFDGLAPRPPHWRDESVYPDASHRFDIAGNALYCNLLTKSFQQAFEFAGYSPLTSAFLGAGSMGIIHTFMKYRESLYFGARSYEFTGAWAGIGLAVLQTAVPEVQRVQLKWFWYDRRKERDFEWSFIEEYRPQRFFLAVRLGDLVTDLPVLRGLGLAYGGGLWGDDGVIHYIGLDLDMRQVLPGALGEATNYIHLPLPALCFKNGRAWIGLAL